MPWIRREEVGGPALETVPEDGAGLVRCRAAAGESEGSGRDSAARLSTSWSWNMPGSPCRWWRSPGRRELDHGGVAAVEVDGDAGDERGRRGHQERDQGAELLRPRRCGRPAPRAPGPSARRSRRASRAAPPATQRRSHWPLLTIPRQIALTRMPSGASSFESAFVRASPAARLTEVGSERAPGVLAPVFRMLTMRPPPAFRMGGTQSRTQRIAAKSFSSRSACQAASSTVSKPRAAEVPALLTRMSIRPNRSSVSATSRSRSPARVTSAATSRNVAPVRSERPGRLREARLRRARRSRRPPPRRRAAARRRARARRCRR